MRKAAQYFVALFMTLLLGTASAWGQDAGAPLGDQLLASGQTYLAILDSDGNGRPDPSDCWFEGFITPMDGLVILGNQDINNPLQICGGNSVGDAGLGTENGTNYAEATIRESPIGGPIAAVMNDTMAGPGALPVQQNGVGDNITLLYPLLSRQITGNTIGTGTLLCNQNGLVASIALPGGAMMIWELELFPDEMNPTHLRIPQLPVWDPGGMVLIDAYVPVDGNGVATVAVASDPGAPLLRIDLKNLPGCVEPPEPTPVPALNRWGEIAGLLLFLGLGAWVLFRRPRVKA